MSARETSNKILFYIGSNQFGGAERVIINLCNEFVQRGYDVSLLFGAKGTEAYWVDDRIKQVVIEEYMGKSHGRALRCLKRLKTMEILIQNEAPKVMVSFLPENNFRAILVGKKLKIPVVISVRVDPCMECNTVCNKLLRRLLYNSADAVVLQNKGSRERFGRWFHAQYEVIPNPINQEFIVKPFVKARKKVIVTMGRLSEQKNHMLLIRAFEKVSQKYPDYKLIIYGEGEQRQPLEHMVRKLRMMDKVFLPGNTREIIPEIYNAGIFVLSSNYEGVPNALLEAMSLGLPCIATDVPNGGCREVIQNQWNGLLIPTNSEKALIEAILFMIENEELAKQMGTNAQKIQNVYAPAAIYDQWEKYLTYFMTN